MQVFQNKSKIVITCNKRLSTYLQQEVELLGYTVTKNFGTGVELEGTLNDCIPLNLNLRCASQVLYSIKSFQADNPARLYKELLDIAWEELIDFTGYFSVASNVDNETITTPLFANLKVKDAIVKNGMSMPADIQEIKLYGSQSSIPIVIKQENE